MGIWSHADKLYEISSGYILDNDAWEYELMGLTGPPGTGPYLTLAIPDATLDGPFTPRPARFAVVRAGGGTVPWPILQNLIDVVEAGGDLVDEQREPAELPLTRNEWSHEGRRYEIEHFHHGDKGAWCYELLELGQPEGSNIFVEVLIPDAAPDGGPFIPLPSDRVTLTMHGRWTIPWPIFRRFLDAVHTAGDIV